MCKIVKMKVITPVRRLSVDICKAFVFAIPDGCAPASSQSSSLHNSLRSIKQTAVWRLSSFSPSKFCELRDFAYGQNLCVLYAKFPPPKAKRLQLVMPLGPHRGRMIAFATAVRSGPFPSVAREIPASLAFKAAPRKCKQASIPLGLHLN